MAIGIWYPSYLRDTCDEDYNKIPNKPGVYINQCCIVIIPKEDCYANHV